MKFIDKIKKTVTYKNANFIRQKMIMSFETIKDIEIKYGIAKLTGKIPDAEVTGFEFTKREIVRELYANSLVLKDEQIL